MRKTRCTVCRRYTSGKRFCRRAHCQKLRWELDNLRRQRTLHPCGPVIGCRYDLSDARQRAMLGLVIRPRGNDVARYDADARGLDFAPALSQRDARAIHARTTAIALALLDC